MIKIISNVFKAIFLIFLFLLFMIKMFFFVNNKISNIYYPNIFGYSYMKTTYKNDDLDIGMNEYLFTIDITNVNSGDVIVYLDGKIPCYAEVISEDNEYYLCNNGDNNNIIISKEDYGGKVIYANKFLSKVINILVNPITIVFMIFYILFIDQITYKRY